MNKPKKKEILRELHTICDQRFHSFVLAKQTFSKIFGMLETDKKASSTTQGQINVILRDNRFKEDFKKATQRIEVKPINKKIEEQIAEVWKKIDELRQFYTVFSGTISHANASNTYCCFKDTEEQFKGLLHMVDNEINNSLIN